MLLSCQQPQVKCCQNYCSYAGVHKQDENNLSICARHTVHIHKPPHKEQTLNDFVRATAEINNEVIVSCCIISMMFWCQEEVKICVFVEIITFFVYLFKGYGDKGLF